MEFDLRYVRSSFGMGMSIIFVNGTGNNGFYIELTDHYVGANRGQLRLRDYAGHDSGFTPTTDTSTWYRVRIAYDPSSQTADFVMRQRDTQAVFYEEYGLAFAPGPFDGIGFGAYTRYWDGTDAEMRVDNIAVSASGVSIAAQAGDQISFCYADSLDGVGNTVERCATTDVLGGTDGEIRATVVSQPGDTVRVRVDDADLSDAVAVDVTNTRTGESESILLSQFSAGSSVFYGRFFTATTSGVGDSALAVQKGDVLSIAYADTLTANGGTATVVDDDEVVDPFGDAHANGSVQAYDAAQVLIHRLSTYGGDAGTLSGLDSLSANVDQGAPFSIIDGYDASLILRKVVGLINRFEVQKSDAVNHPQPETAARPKAVPEERVLSLRVAEDHMSVWADERDGIVSGEVTVEGIAGVVVLSEELVDFLSVSRVAGEAVQVVFAGAEDVDGPGELLRVYGVGPEQARLTRVRLNGGWLEVRTAEAESATLPRAFALLGNAPNPFNPETAIRFELAAAGPVELTVYDVVGQRVRTLVSASLPAGAHRVVWDGRDEAGSLVSSGVYFYRLVAGERFAQMQRMMFLK